MQCYIRKKQLVRNYFNIDYVLYAQKSKLLMTNCKDDTMSELAEPN